MANVYILTHGSSVAEQSKGVLVAGEGHQQSTHVPRFPICRAKAEFFTKVDKDSCQAQALDPRFLQQFDTVR